MNRIIYILMFVSSFMMIVDVNAITLDECKNAARENYPLIRQFSLIEKSQDLNLSNAAKAWVPGVNVSGFAVGFTNIIDNLPINNSIYGASVMVSQVVYDGGAIKAQKEVIRAKSKIDEAQTDVSMYDINERVEQLYFGVLMIDEHLKQVELLSDNLKISENSVKSLMQSGLANQGDLELVNVNQIQAQQQAINLHTMRDTYIGMLSYFCPSLSICETSVLEMPEMEVNEEKESVTLSLYDYQETLFDAEKKTLNARITPTIGAFAADIYHSSIIKGSNNNLFIGGGLVRWNIGAFYTRKNDLEILQNKRAQLSVQRETFLFNKNLQLKKSGGHIDNLKKQLDLDQQTVTLRQSILEKSRKKVENGTETVNEMLRCVNAVSEANLQKTIHSVELLSEIYKLNTIKGK